MNMKKYRPLQKIKKLFRKYKIVEDFKKEPILNYNALNNKPIVAEGRRSIALGIWDFPIPTGICSNPEDNEIKEVVRKDKLGQLLNNPITHCIFCNKSNMYCFFGGDCKNKGEIPLSLVEKYKKEVENEIEKKYGKRPN